MKLPKRKRKKKKDLAGEGADWWGSRASRAAAIRNGAMMGSGRHKLDAVSTG